ncbi:MAG: hypothetical protein IJ762_10270 [Bacteroidaceae bacterium]|nr:hypothetical protein [Bacteroidaceae bacterium]
MKRFYQTLWAVGLSLSLAAPVGAQQRVEYFWDEDPGVGLGTVLKSFTGAEATATAQLDVSTFTPGIHRLGLRVLNGEHFSSTCYRSFFVPAPEETVTRIEYAWDNIPAPGKGTALTFTPGTTVELTRQLSVSGLSEGIHTLYLQARSVSHPSSVYERVFYVPPTAHRVEAVEYFFDTDPGVGRGTRMAATLTGDELAMAFELPTGTLSEGIHHLGLRTLTDGTWSETKYRQFLVRTQVENYVTRFEYFWNTDPGYGQGHYVDITPGKEVTLDFEADMTDLPEGTHALGLRAQSGSRGWSTTSWVTGIEFEGWDNLQEYLNSLEDTEDTYAGGTYTRQYRNTDWQPLYVPFSLRYSDWADRFEVARINAFYQYDDDEDGVVDRQVLEAIKVTARNGDLRPNHPYLIRARWKDRYSFTPDASRTAAEQIQSVSCSTVEARYTFTGTYTPLTGMKSADIYRLRGGSLSVPETDEEVLPPFRWYLTIDDLGNQLQPSASEVKLQVLDFGDPTSVGDPMSADPMENADCYDLSGRRMADGQMKKKGIYIINHKKVFVK